jgi:diadenosine tetraphosphate (Ap4A) HIT family hydrolase
LSLDHLWAAWRSEYITAAVNEPPRGDGSVFSRILSSGAPDAETHIVWRGDLTFAILNAFPYTSGHVLVMPMREVGELAALTNDEHVELWAAVRSAVAAVQAAYRPEGVNVGANLGRAAGAGIPTHLHVHVLPRWAGDTNFMTAVAGVRVMPEALAESAAKIRAAWP